MSRIRIVGVEREPSGRIKRDHHGKSKNENNLEKAGFRHSEFGHDKVVDAIKRTRELRKERMEEFERDKEEADRVRARTLLQSLDAMKLINRRSNGF